MGETYKFVPLLVVIDLAIIMTCFLKETGHDLSSIYRETAEGGPSKI